MATELKLNTPHYKELIRTALAARTAGQMLKIGSLVGVFFEACSLGDKVTFIYQADKITLPCKTAGTGEYTQGSKVYFDATGVQGSYTGILTNVASGNTLCGWVIKDASVGDTEIMIQLENGIS